VGYYSQCNPHVKRNLVDKSDFYGYIFAMARPKKDPSDRKSVDVRIPLTEEQKKLVTEAAEAEGADVATWIRPIMLDAAHSKLAKRAKRSGK
jgi:hypothetical protein